MPGLDALRGCMLVLMTVTHLPVSLNAYVGQPVGFVSAAEGFVFLSAFLAGLVYSQRAERVGLASMSTAVWRRALQLYGCQVGLLLFAFTTAAAMEFFDHEQSIRNLLHFYFQHPWTALWNGLVLLYNPPLLDILPMYILFMAATPLVLAWAARRGWPEPIALSVVVWLFAQFGLREVAYEGLINVTGARIPLAATGAFDIFAWQLMWMVGLRLGSYQAAEGHQPVVPRWGVLLALGIALPLLAWRHLIGQVPFGLGSPLNVLFGKWHLGPLRIMNFAALLVLAIHYGPRWQRWIRIRFLERLGAASLPVYCVHIMLCLVALCLLGDQASVSPLQQAGLLGGSLLTLYGVAALRPRWIGSRSGPAAASHVQGAARLSARVPPD